VRPDDIGERQGTSKSRGTVIGRLGQVVAARIPSTDFFRGALTIAGATGAGQLITILAAPIITRLYAPAAYGTFAVAGTLLSLLIALACLRYELAVPLPRSDVNAASVLVVCFGLMAFIGIGLFPAMWLFGGPVFGALGAPELADYRWLLPLGVVAGGSLAALGAWMLRIKAFRALAEGRILQSGAGIGLQVGLGVLGAGALGLLVGWIAGMATAVARLAWVTWRQSAPAIRAVSGRTARAAASRYRRFPIFSSPSTAITFIGLEAPVLWVVATYGVETGGQFALAQRIVALPVLVLASAVGQVYFAEAARIGREEPARLPEFYKRATSMLLVVAAGPFVLGMLAAPSVFPVLFGDAWTVAGLYAAILAPSYLLQFVAWPTGGTLDVLERQDLHLAREVARLVLVGAAVVLSTVAQLPAIQAVIALSVSGSIANALYAYISWRALRLARVRES
jgi:O-antigen/teichoic acid export membrane protein